MSKFTIEIETDNAAFEGNGFDEIARILEVEARRLRHWARSLDDAEWHSQLRDINGNKVGLASLN